MTLVNRVRQVCAAVLVAAAAVFASQAQAQEISDGHLKAARAAIAAIHATDPFDAILPQAATSLKQQLILQNPDLEELVVTTVDETALAMAGRRGDLEREAALAYARQFTEQDLNAIAAFYVTDAGKKLLTNGPNAARDVAQAAQIWQNGIQRDLTEAVTKKVSQVVQAQAKDNPAPQEAEPADGAPAQ